jgi:hypothetical protein
MHACSSLSLILFLSYLAFSSSSISRAFFLSLLFAQAFRRYRYMWGHVLASSVTRLMSMKSVPGRELSESCHSPTHNLPSLFPSRLGDLQFAGNGRHRKQRAMKEHRTIADPTDSEAAITNADELPLIKCVSIFPSVSLFHIHTRSLTFSLTCSLLFPFLPAVLPPSLAPFLLPTSLSTHKYTPTGAE